MYRDNRQILYVRHESLPNIIENIYVVHTDLRDEVCNCAHTHTNLVCHTRFR